ncbi:MAG: reactive intermediate/imine deaminase [Candidatus Marinimicrobia bacterium]|nr:reactive intermediate/imine deaminase [Candidatus Neomarinimicrobiota bacterium]MBL7022656.1 reactive intermediate/imine deaminase [Candidatus Neomarinimicrobiota bacterium]MBL7109920.1 reactive intermediate/imine deaminase [Candidatus Neomarinimicrobiota bacterium]
MREVISTNDSPTPIGTYSPGIKTDNLIFTSGQIAINPETGEMVQDDFASEIRQAMDNLKAIIEAGGSSMNKIVKITVYLTDLKNYDILNRVFSVYFTDELPARSAVEVSALPKGANVEIEAIALVEK